MPPNAFNGNIGPFPEVLPQTFGLSEQPTFLSHLVKGLISNDAACGCGLRIRSCGLHNAPNARSGAIVQMFASHHASRPLRKPIGFKPRQHTILMHLQPDAKVKPCPDAPNCPQRQHWALHGMGLGFRKGYFKHSACLSNQHSFPSL